MSPLSSSMKSSGLFRIEPFKAPQIKLFLSLSLTVVWQSLILQIRALVTYIVQQVLVYQTLNVLIKTSLDGICFKSQLIKSWIFCSGFSYPEAFIQKGNIDKYQFIISSQTQMGQNQSKDEPPNLDDLVAVKDNKYGGAIKVDSYSQKAYQTFYIDEVSNESFRQLLKSRQKLKHPYFVSVRRYWVKSFREPCSLDKRYGVTVEYQFYNKNLQNKIREYCDKRRPFPQLQLRKTFSGVVNCLKYLKENNTCHGDIKPQNILFDSKVSESNSYLIDSYFINGGKISYQLVMQDPQSMSLLSPQQLQNLRNKKFASIQEIHKDEMFSVGLTMLETMTAEPAMECYDLKNLRLKNGYFSNKYNEMLSYGYSDEIAKVVMNCLNPQPENRLTFDQFLNILDC